MINDKKIIGSVVGPHAGETLEEIWDRKNDDILQTGKTIWLVNSAQVSPGIIKKFCVNKDDIYMYFLLSSGNKQGKQTKKKECAKFYSNDLKKWNEIDNKWSPITGKINLTTTGIVINSIEEIENNELDFCEYKDHLDGIRPIMSFRGGSTFCAEKLNRKIIDIKSNIRQIVARARLCEPYAVFLKK